MIVIPIVIGTVAVLAGVGFELHKRAQKKAVAVTATSNAKTLNQPVQAAAQSPQSQAVAAAAAAGNVIAQQAIQAATNATNQAAGGNKDAAQQAMIVLATPSIIEDMEKAAGGISIQEMDGITAAVGTSVQNMLTVSFIQNPGADPSAVARDVASTIAAMK